MSPEDVARQHQFREGFRLVDFGEVGLPIFRLTVEAVTMAQRSLPTIQEFVMRCLAMGETQEADVARMLGLKNEIVRGSVNALVSDGYVSRQPGPGEASFRLTEAGETRLGYEREEVPQEEMLVIDYDGIRRVPVRLTGESVVRAAELNTAGAVQIRPYPAEPPSIEHLNIPDVTRVIRRQGGEDFRRTVLALKRVVRRNNLFREAVALVFVGEKTDEVQVAFVISGKLSDAHERAFAEHSGPRKMGFVRSIAVGETRRQLERSVGKAMMRRLPGAQDVRAMRKEEADAFVAASVVRPLADRISGRARQSDPAVAGLVAAEERLQVARHALNALAVRPLACFEQDELLDEALEKASQSLVLTTAGWQSTILTGFRLRSIDALIGKGVRIQMESVLPPQTEPRGGDHFDPLAEISKRSERGLLSLRKGERREFYFLVQDDELAVVCNRPFLGEVSRRAGFICVEGIVARSRELVEEIRQIALPDRGAKRRDR